MVQMHSRKGTTEVHEFEGMFNGFRAYFKVTSVIGHVFRSFFLSPFSADPLVLALCVK